MIIKGNRMIVDREMNPTLNEMFIDILSGYDHRDPDEPQDLDTSYFLYKIGDIIRFGYTDLEVTDAEVVGIEYKNTFKKWRWMYVLKYFKNGEVKSRLVKIVDSDTRFHKVN